MGFEQYKDDDVDIEVINEINVVDNVMDTRKDIETVLSHETLNIIKYLFE